jgi:hypothetical protein
MRAAASGPVQAVCRCGKGCGDTYLNMPVGKIYPEDFVGRANRHDHAAIPKTSLHRYLTLAAATA